MCAEEAWHDRSRKVGSVARNAGLDDSQNAAGVGAATWLWGCPAHRAGQSRCTATERNTVYMSLLLRLLQQRWIVAEWELPTITARPSFTPSRRGARSSSPLRPRIGSGFPAWWGAYCDWKGRGSHAQRADIAAARVCGGGRSGSLDRENTTTISTRKFRRIGNCSRIFLWRRECRSSTLLLRRDVSSEIPRCYWRTGENCARSYP